MAKLIGKAGRLPSMQDYDSRNRPRSISYDSNVTTTLRHITTRNPSDVPEIPRPSERLSGREGGGISWGATTSRRRAGSYVTTSYDGAVVLYAAEAQGQRLRQHEANKLMRS